MNSNRHLKTGKAGEEFAAEYLRSKGYTIEAMNARFGKAEIDIIASIGEDVVFVEIKTRSSAYFGYPEEFVSARKIELLGEAARIYCEQNKLEEDVRFDLIALIATRDGFEISHTEDAFFPGAEF